MHRMPLTKRSYLRELVYQKNLWDEPLSEQEKGRGFLGWHERGYLPHCDKPGLVQLVTFRLVDSMPTSRRGEWEHLLKIENVRERRNQLESYLDRGMGECWLRDPRIAKVCEEALLFFHNARYELLAWCVMPNHVHVLVHIWDWPLWRLVASWKRYCGTKASCFTDLPKRSSQLRAFWQREYWDTFMRSEAQENKAIWYVESNPVKAKLCPTTEAWLFSSARFRDKYRRLVLPATPPSIGPEFRLGDRRFDLEP